MAPRRASVSVGGLVFDRADYDSEGDVSYLHVGAARPAARSEETPEGHVVRYDEAGRVIGLTIVNARFLFDRDGALRVTLAPLEVATADLVEALRRAG